MIKKTILVMSMVAVSGCSSSTDNTDNTDNTDRVDTTLDSYVSNWEGKTQELKLWSLSSARFSVNPNAPQSDTGFVEGINYSYTMSTGAVVEGITDNKGILSYEYGVPVTFKIGAITFGSVNVEEAYLVTENREKEVSALSFSDDSQTIKNITAFLYSIDDDDYSLNGIQVTEAMKNKIISDTIDWGSLTFSSDASVVNLVKSITSVSSAGERSVVYSDVDVLNSVLTKDQKIFFSVDWHDDNFQGVNDNFMSMTVDGSHLIMKDGSWGTVFDGQVSASVYEGTWVMSDGGSGAFKYTIN